MFRLTKYEIRKNITGLVILFGVIMGLEIYFLISALTENRDHTAISTSLLIISTIVAYFCVFIFGVATYSKELNSKTSYMTFMTPISSFSVIGSKLLSTFIAGVFFAILLVILAFADMALFENVFPESKLFSEFLDVLFDMAGYSAVEFWLSVLVSVIEILVSFFSVVAMAYLAITLSSTAFQNKKYKGVVSVGIFVAIVFIVIKLGECLPEVYDRVTDMTEAMIATVPSLIYFTVITVMALFASARLLDKKVSL